MKGGLTKLEVQHWQRLREIYLASGRSLRELQRETGIPKSRLSRIMSGTAPLTVSTLQALAIALRFDPKGFVGLGRSKWIDAFASNDTLETQQSADAFSKLLRRADRSERESGRELTIDKVLGWYHETNGRLENAGKILPYLSIFQPPTSSTEGLEALHVGRKSLACESLLTDDPQAVQKYLQSLSESTRKDIIYSYFSTQASNSYQIYARKVLVDLPDVGRPYELNYATLLLPMVGKQGRDVVVNHSVLVSVKFVDTLPSTQQDHGLPA